MPAIQPPTQFTVTKDTEIEGTVYTRGTTIPAATAAGFRKLDVLVSTRTLLPDVEPHGRETDDFGFGDPPRKHPTPTHYTPGARSSW
jgi:hypothetical protein